MPEVKIPQLLADAGLTQELFADRVETCKAAKRDGAWQAELDNLAAHAEKLGTMAAMAAYREVLGTGWEGCTRSMVETAAKSGGNGRVQQAAGLCRRWFDVTVEPYAEADRESSEAQADGECPLCRGDVEPRGLWVEKWCIICDLTHNGPDSSEPVDVYDGYVVTYGDDGRTTSWEAP